MQYVIRRLFGQRECTLWKVNNGECTFWRILSLVTRVTSEFLMDECRPLKLLKLLGEKNVEYFRVLKECQWKWILWLWDNFIDFKIFYSSHLFAFVIFYDVRLRIIISHSQFELAPVDLKMAAPRIHCMGSRWLNIKFCSYITFGFVSNLVLLRHSAQ